MRGPRRVSVGVLRDNTPVFRGYIGPSLSARTVSFCPWLWSPWAAKVRIPLSANHSKSPTDYAREEKTPPAIAQAARDAFGGTWHGRHRRMRQSARVHHAD